MRSSTVPFQSSHPKPAKPEGESQLEQGLQRSAEHWNKINWGTPTGSRTES